MSSKYLYKKYDIKLYHYSYVFPTSVRNKAEYYSKMNWGHGHEDGVIWFNKEWQKIGNPLRVHIIKFPPSWIIPFDEEHPNIIKNMISTLGFRENHDVVSYLGTTYKKYQNIGERLSKIILNYRCYRKGKYIKIIQVLMNLLFPSSMWDWMANRSILIVAKQIMRD